MHRIWAGALVAALALTLVMAGCGGDDPLTRAELVKEASAICRRVNDETLQALKDAQKRHDRLTERGPAFAELVAKVADLRQSAADDLDELKPPAALSIDYDRFVAARQAMVDMLPSKEQATAGNDPKAEQRGAREASAARIAERLKIRC